MWHTSSCSPWSLNYQEANDDLNAELTTITRFLNHRNEGQKSLINTPGTRTADLPQRPCVLFKSRGHLALFCVGGHATFHGKSP